MIFADMDKTILTDNNKTDLLYSDLTYKIRGALFNVYNELGYGHKEQVYQRALTSEFQELKIAYKQEKSLSVTYKGKQVGNYRPDFVIEEKIILEIKAVEFITKVFGTQLINYLKTTGFKLGLLVNFGGPKLYIKRLVWTEYPRESYTNQRKSL